jgi:hypothetical protein
MVRVRNSDWTPEGDNKPTGSRELLDDDIAQLRRDAAKGDETAQQLLDEMESK